MHSKKESSNLKSSFKKIVIELHKCADKHCGKIMSKKDLQEYKKEMNRIVKICSKKKNYKDMVKCTTKERNSVSYKKYVPKIKKRTKCIKKNCM
jgi:hypothetical protein